jgi:hypothetical protein
MAEFANLIVNLRSVGGETLKNETRATRGDSTSFDRIKINGAVIPEIRILQQLGCNSENRDVGVVGVVGQMGLEHGSLAEG